MSEALRDPAGSPPSDGGPAPDESVVRPDGVAERPTPIEPLKKVSRKHLIGYPATALIALIIGSSGSSEPAAPAATPAVPTVTATVTATVTETATETVTTPGPTVTQTVTVKASAPKPTATPKAAAPAPLKAPSPKPAYTAPKPATAYYANCAAARAAGAAPLYRGDPGYRSGLDRDGDGVACE